MKEIHKYSISILSGSNVIPIPGGAKILSIANQYNVPQIWALVDPAAPKEERIFVSYLTGSSVDENPGKFIGAVLLNGGGFVVHVFERGK